MKSIFEPAARKRTLAIVFALVFTGASVYAGGFMHPSFAFEHRDPGSLLDPEAPQIAAEYVSGDFDGDGRLDMVRIVDGRVLMHSGLAIFDSLQEIGHGAISGAVALDVLRGEAGEVDELLIAGAQGTERWYFEGTTGEYVGVELSPIPASDVCAVDAEEGAGVWVCSLETNGEYLHSILVRDGQVLEDNEVRFDGVLGLELSGLRWFEGEDPRLAIRMETEIQIWKPKGYVEEVIPFSVDVFSITTLRRPAMETDALLSVVNVHFSNKDYKYCGVQSSGGVSGPYLELGANPLTAVACEDLNGDGSTDLLMTYQGFEAVYVIPGDPMSETNEVFVMSESFPLGIVLKGDGDLYDAPAALVADFDLSGTFDVVIDGAKSNGYVYSQNEDMSGANQLVLHIDEDTGYVDTDGDEYLDTLQVQANLPPGSFDPTWLAEVIAYSKNGSAAALSDPLIYYLSPIGAGDSIWTFDISDFGVKEDIMIVSRFIDPSDATVYADSLLQERPDSVTGNSSQGGTKGEDDEVEAIRPVIDFGDVDRPPGVVPPGTPVSTPVTP